jgi:hypothetical protein
MREHFDRQIAENMKHLNMAYRECVIARRKLDLTERVIETREQIGIDLEGARQNWDTQNAVDDAARMEAEKKAVEAQEAKDKKQQPKRRK